MSDYPMLISNKLHSFRNFSVLKYRYLYFVTAVVTSSHSRDEFLPRLWKDLVTAVES